MPVIPSQQQRGEPAAVDHRGLDVLGFTECLHRIASTPLGRVAFHDGGDLLVLPVNHVIDGVAVAFRTRWDSRLAAAVREEPVAFEVDHYDPTAGTGWSVLVTGTAAVIDDETTCQRLEELLGIPWAGAPEDSFWIGIRADEVTGRELTQGRSTCGCC